MKIKNNFPIIILDIILEEEKKMNKEEKSIFKILKNKNEKLKEYLIWVTKIFLEDFYVWVIELKGSEGKSHFILYSKNLSKYSKEYRQIILEEGLEGKKLVGYGEREFVPIEFKFLKREGEIDWIIKIYNKINKISPEDKSKLKKKDLLEPFVEKKITKKRKKWKIINILIIIILLCIIYFYLI